MGVFDSILGKKGRDDDVTMEPCEGGYTLKGTRLKAPRISSVYIYFNSTTPLKDEPDVLKGIIMENGVAQSIAPGALIAAGYESIPDIDDYLVSNEMPESLNAFIMARAMMSGLARNQAEMCKLAVNPFDFKGIKGVLILKEV
jgi:hypothetical protein